MQILRSCCFPFKYPTHGGIHRSEQVLEIFLSHNISVTELDQISLKHFHPLNSRVIGTLDSLRKRDWDAFSSRRLGSIGQTFAKYDQALLEHQYDALIWETVGESVTPDIGRKYSLPVIAMPLNLEAFFKVIMQKQSSKMVFHHLRQEINSLKLADAVFAISAEEQITYRNFGIEADYLPYYPPQRLIDFYSEIRYQRTYSKKTALLILGSVNNQTTCEGIVELIEWLDRSFDARSPEVTLVGNHTESLKGLFHQPWLKIYGTATQDELKQLLIEAKAVLIHQKVGIGVLTRIPEMLVAGMPVVANRIAARSVAHLPGVFTYDCWDELQECLNQEFLTPPMPQPPKQAIKRLVQTISTYSSAKSQR